MIEMALGNPQEDSDTRGRILASAAALFGERGYASTSLRMIAGTVGMTPPALYWYFPSKQAILLALLRRVLFDFLEAVEEDVVGPEPEDKLRQLVRAHVRRGVEQPRIGPYEPLFGLRQLAQFLSEDQQAELIAGQRRHLDLVRATLREGIASGRFRDLEVTSTAFAILSMCDYVTSWWKPTGPVGAEELAALYEDLAVRMVCRRAGDAAPSAGRERRVVR